jgi:hypothetical protein
MVLSTKKDSKKGKRRKATYETIIPSCPEPGHSGCNQCFNISALLMCFGSFVESCVYSWLHSGHFIWNCFAVSFLPIMNLLASTYNNYTLNQRKYLMLQSFNAKPAHYQVNNESKNVDEPYNSGNPIRTDINQENDSATCDKQSSAPDKDITKSLSSCFHLLSFAFQSISESLKAMIYRREIHQCLTPSPKREAPRKNNMACAKNVRVLSTKDAHINAPTIRIMPATIRIRSIRIMSPSLP